jgi:beta-galactosidase
MRTGVCYYPEQWPRARWATDAAEMRELGLDLVRIGEFAWSSFEPARGAFEFSWLDEALETLSAAGLQIVLGTPTATPPVWLMRERPEILSVGPDGRRRAYGSRRHTSPSSRAYREEARRVVQVLVDRYGSHPAIVAWQIDNEPGNHDSARCFSDESQAAFQAWLAARFDRDIDALNAAWGTAFWSMTYPSFDAIELPRPTVTDHNPSLEVAHRRFAAEEVAAGLAEQRAIVAAGAPHVEVFTNLYLGDVDIDPRLVARPTGIGAVDVYPHGLRGPDDVSFILDLVRGIALPAGAGPSERGGCGWVIEQQPGPVNWTGDNPAVPPGQVRLWCWQAALHGIDTLLWFRWRAARAGQEQHHAALLRHDGTRSPAWGEAARFLAELAEVAAGRPALVERPVARVALVHEHLDAFMLQVVPQVPDASHRELVIAVHAAARRLGLDVDVVGADADLTGYELVLAPAAHVASTGLVDRLSTALHAGTTVVLGPRSLVRDEHAVWSDQPLPAGLSARLGARVEHAGSPVGWPRDPAFRSRVRLGGAATSGAGSADATGGAGAPEPLDATGGAGAPEPLDAGGWIETLTDLADDVQALGWADGPPLHGAPVIARRRGLVHVGAASSAVWAAVLAELTGRTASPAGTSTFVRDGSTITIDHRSLTIDGLLPPADGASSRSRAAR